MKPASNTSPQSVQRIFGILELLSRSKEGETLSALSRHLDAPKNSVVSLLAGMLQKDHVTRDERAVYRLGPAMLQLSLRIAGGMRLRGLVRPALERIRDATGETALAARLLPGQDQLTYIEKAESLHPMRYTVPVGERRELYSTAAGKLMLAYMSDDDLAAFLARVELAPLTGTTITDAHELRAGLQGIRATGVSTTLDERIAGASAIAAPVLDGQGRLVVSLGVVGPSARLHPRLAACTDGLVQEARQLSALVADAGEALTLQT